MAVQNIRADEEVRYIFEPGESAGEGNIVCTHCGKVFKGARHKREYVFCPECTEFRAEQEAMKQRNRRYRQDRIWNLDSHLDSNAQEAKAHDMSYGMYMAMKNAGWLV